MSKFKILISLILFTQISCCAFSAPQPLIIQDDNSGVSSNNTYQEKPATKLLKGGISQVQELPQGMYGMWQVSGTLLETNDVSKYIPKSSDVWVLQKNGEYVTLVNPRNGASATITVTEVENNTATFIRKIESYNYVESEQVTITLKGDNFFGTDVLITQGYGMRTTTARYSLKGTKMSGQTLYRPIRHLDLQSNFVY